MGGFITVLVCIIVAIAWGLKAAGNRHSELSELAGRLGLRFDSERNYRIAERYVFLAKLRQGSNRYAYNIMEGDFHGHDVAAFDYHYETHSTKSNRRQPTNHHRFSFFILKLDRDLPELTIAKKGLFSRIALEMGYSGIKIETQELSHEFVARSKDKEFAHDFCTDGLIDYLLHHPDINIEIEQDLLVLGFNNCLKVEEIESRLNQLVEIRSLMPPHLFIG